MWTRLMLMATLLLGAVPWGAAGADLPGVTATSITIGNTCFYSGPASAYGAIGRTEAAYFKDLNARGGVDGHKINFISLDDAYQPPKTVEDVRQLVEQDGVAFMFNSLGTPTNTAVQKYLNTRHIPQLFVGTGADKWGNYKDNPWTIGWQASYRTEAQIYAKYILAQKPDAKIALLYQNDDFGKDYLLGMKDVLGDRFDGMVTAISYETSDPTVDSQIVSLQGSGADTLVVAAVSKFAAQSIRKVHEIGWQPLFFMSNVSISVGMVLQPAGKENAVGMISATYAKDPTDPDWANDPGMNEWRSWMKRNMPDADMTDGAYVYGFALGQTMEHVLRQAKGDFSRANIMKQATNITDLPLGTLLPGVTIHTTPTSYHPITQMQLEKWNGETWVRFGDIIGGVGS